MKSDAILVRSVLSGNRDAYADLVRRYERPVQAAAWAIIHDLHAAQDVAQEAFVKAYLSLPTLRNPDCFGAWVLAAARRAALSAVRVASRTVLSGPLSNAASAEPAEQDERLSRVLARVALLPEHEQCVVMLRYINCLSVAEIAATTGQPTGTVTKQLSRALARLRENFKEKP